MGNIPACEDLAQNLSMADRLLAAKGSPPSNPHDNLGGLAQRLVRAPGGHFCSRAATCLRYLNSFLVHRCEHDFFSSAQQCRSPR